MKIKVLYEDKDILVIDKPSGISVHPDGRSKEKTITDWILKNYPKIKGVGEPMNFDGNEIDRPGIVHRLDKDTSGVLVIAKNKKSYDFLKKQFTDREIKKIYIAIVNGWLKNDKGIIDKPIGRSPSDFRRRLAGRGARGELRDAVTEYKVLKRVQVSAYDFFSRLTLPRVPGGTLTDKKNHKQEVSKFSILEVYPKTGRTHQIRVHMKYLSFPIVCDSLYNPKGLCPEGLNRMGLHAKSIEFKNQKGKLIKIESPLPKEFKKMLK
ncbi:MAG: RluA family pseudouridine synthase [bacterium]